MIDVTSLINRNNLLNSEYVPEDLIITDNNENNFHNYKDPHQKPMISKIIMPYFLAMQKAAAKEGINIIVDSGYRSYNYQKVIWDKYVEEKGLEETQRSVAIPGSSEHQSGLAFDVACIRDGVYKDDIKKEDKEVEWLVANAYKFGFILRYPEGKEHITGYKFEPWHYRFVGVYLATIIHKEGITLEEYYERAKKEVNTTSHNVYLSNFVDRLLENQNKGANLAQQNLFSKEEYYEFLKPVIKVIKNNKDASLEELRTILFEQSGLIEAAKTLVNEQKLTPGLVFSYGSPRYSETLAIGNKQEVTLDSHGKIIPKIEKMTIDTIFDLASVTKLFTSITILKLVELGLINLDENITTYAPEFKNLRNITIFDLLTFRVPLATVKRIDAASSREEAEAILFDIRINENFNLDSNPYSDMGAMVLKYVIEKVVNMPYYEFLYNEILSPLKLYDTHIVIPDNKIQQVASTNLDSKIFKDGKTTITTEVKKGIVYDPKARVMGQKEGNLSGHAGLFSTVSDVSNLAKNLLSGQVITAEEVQKMGINQTGKMKSDGSGYIQHLGELVYSKNPDTSNSEVWHGLSGQSFASAGWLGHKLAVDPLNDIYAFMAANRSHNRVTYVDPSIRPQVEVKNENQTFIELPSGLKIDATKFAWYKHTIINPCLKLALQYKLLDEILENKDEKTENIARNI